MTLVFYTSYLSYLFVLVECFFKAAEKEEIERLRVEMVRKKHASAQYNLGVAYYGGGRGSDASLPLKRHNMPKH